MRHKYIYTRTENWKYWHIQMQTVNTILAKCHKETIM